MSRSQSDRQKEHPLNLNSLQVPKSNNMQRDKESLMNKSHYSNQEDKQEKIKEKYSYPADIAKAELHKQAFKFGAKRSEKEYKRCKCCNNFEVEEDYPICSTPWERKEGQDKSTIMPSGVFVYLTFIKGVIFLLFSRFVIFDIWTILQANRFNYFCSDLFRKSSMNLCAITISGYNLKSDGNYMGYHLLDYLNALFTFSALFYFVLGKKYLESRKQTIELEDIEEDHFAIMAENIPNSLIVENNQGKNVINSKQKFKKLLSDEFRNKIVTWIKNDKRPSLQAQYNFFKLFVPDQCLSSTISNNLNNFYLQANNEKDFLLDQIRMQIVTQIQLLYDMPELVTIQELRNSLEEQIEEEKIFDQDVQQLMKSYNVQDTQLQKKFAGDPEESFHLSHFTGKAIISFQYRYFRDYLINQYQKNNDFLNINGHSIVINKADKPTDINWHNLKIKSTQRFKYQLYTWIILVIFLVVGFVIILLLELWKQGEQVVIQNQTSWQRINRYLVIASSGLATAIINYGLGLVIQIMVESQKHITKSNEVNSFILKSTVAQTLNTLFTYLIIYLIRPSNPLGPYGLVNKAVSAVISTGFITPIFELFQVKRIFKFIKNYKFKRDSDEKDQTQKINLFQIQLNKKFQYFAFSKDQMYVYYILLTFWVSFYGFLAPLITPVIIGLFVFQYWIDKCKIFYWSSPQNFRDDMVERITSVLFISTALSAGSYWAWDISINQSLGFHLKPLNLVCFGIALYFAGFQFFVNSSVKKKLLSSPQQDLDNYYKEKSYEDLILNKKERIIYLSYNPATKYDQHPPKKSENNQKGDKQMLTSKINKKQPSEQQNVGKKCSKCSQKLESDKQSTHCSHFIGLTSRFRCPVCVFGWSDLNKHECQQLTNYFIISNIDDQIITNNLRTSPKFLRFLIGFIFMPIIPLLASLFIALLVIYTLILLATFSIVFPLSVLYFAFRVIFLRECKAENTVIVICFPFLYLKGLLYEVPKQIATTQIFKTILNKIEQTTIRVKHLFYTVNPYKENLSNYTHMEVESQTRRKAYFALMLILLPVMFPLALAYFVVSAVVVLIFTLTCFPFIVWKEKSIPLWTIILFLPVVLLSYLPHQYFKNYLWEQLKELVAFYMNYISTMSCYCCGTCNSGASVNRLQLPQEQPRN